MSTFAVSQSADAPMPTNLDAAIREISALRFELKKAKAQLYQPAPSLSFDATTPSSSVEEADDRCKKLQKAFNATNQKLILCKKELDDAVNKYRLLIRDTSKSREADRDTHNSIFDAIDSVKAEYEDRLRDHDREKAMMEKKLACIVHECARKDEHIHRLKTNLRQSVRGKTEDFRALVEAQGRQKAAHAKELSKVIGDLDQVIEEHNSAKAATDELLERVGEAQGDHGDLQSRLDKATGQVVNLHGQLELQTRAADSLTAENQTLKDKIDLQTDRISDLERDISLLRQQIVDQRSVVSPAGASSSPAAPATVKGDYDESRIRALQTKIDDLNSLIPRERADNAKLRGDKEKLMEELASMKKAFTTLKSTLERTNAAKDTATASSTAASRRIEQMLRDESDKEETHKAERGALMVRIEDLLREADRLKDMNRSLNRQLEKSHGDKQLDLQNQQAQHGGELSALEAQIVELKDMVKHYKERNKELDDDVKKMMQDRRGFEARIMKLEEQVGSEERKIVDLHKLLDDMHRQAEASQQQMAVAQAEAARQRKRADDLQQKLSQASAQITQQQSDIDRLKSRIQSGQNSGSFMQSPTADESRRLASDLQRAKQKLDEMQRERMQKDQELEEALELVARQREKIVRMTEHTQTVVKQTLPTSPDARTPVLRR